MVTTVLTGNQAAGQKFLHQTLWFPVRRSDDHLDAFFREQAQGSLTHAAGQDEIYSQVPQPAGQESGFVRRRGVEFFSVDYSLLYPDHGKLLTMAEVSTHPSLSQWYGYFKGVRFRHGFLR
jgi:hypothetical protein